MGQISTPQSQIHRCWSDQLVQCVFQGKNQLPNQLIHAILQERYRKMFAPDPTVSVSYSSSKCHMHNILVFLGYLLWITFSFCSFASHCFWNVFSGLLWSDRWRLEWSKSYPAKMRKFVLNNLCPKIKTLCHLVYFSVLYVGGMVE